MKLRLAAAMLVLTSVGAYAHDEEPFMSFTSSCRRHQVSNAEYRNCRASKFRALSAAIPEGVDASCELGRCLYRLARSGEDRWVGAGYRVRFVAGPRSKVLLGHLAAGMAVVLTGPDKQDSIFEVCGTCTELDPVKGPIRRAAIQVFSARGLLLALPEKH